MNLSNRVLSLTLALGMSTALSTSAVAQQSVEDFYSNNTFEIHVGYNPGGGYDLYARALAQHMGKHIPGNPDIIVRNVPGAGSLILLNQIGNTADRDGSVMATVGRGAPFQPILGNEQARFDITEMNWIGSMNNETSVCVARSDSGIENLSQLRTQELTVGGAGAGADGEVFPNVLRDVLGYQFVTISGYPGGAEIMLSLERGEIQGRCGWSWSSAVTGHQHWLSGDDPFLNVLVQLSLEKHPDLPDVPLVTDLAENEFELQVLNLLFSRQVIGRPFVMPPDVPADRVAAIREAFMATLRDPEFLASASNLEITPVAGDRVQEILVEASNYPQEVIDVISEYAN